MTHDAATAPSEVAAVEVSAAAPPVLDPPDAAPVPAVDRWRATLAAARLPDTLLGDGDLAADALDLTHAHPSGLATLMAGRSTRLSSLVREPAAHASARRRVRVIKASADELVAERGVRSCYLAAGLVTWWPVQPAADLDAHQTGASWLDVDPAPDPPRPISAPVLLRGCALRPRGAGHDDYELDLDDIAFVNPEVLRRLREEHGIVLDAASVSGLAFGAEGFDPRPVYALLEEVCAAVPGFTIERRLVVGSFTAGSGALLADLDAARLALELHPLLGRLANTTPLTEPPATVDRGTTTRRPFVALDTEPETDDVAFDLDPAQRAALDAALSGSHVAIEGPPGTGLTHTLAATVATLAGRGRRLLVVTPHRHTADAFVRRLTEAGLGDLVLDLHDGVGDRARVLASLAAALEKASSPGAGTAAKAPDPTDPDTAGPDGDGREAVAAGQVRAAAEAVAGASQALHAPRTPWGVSAYDAMVALAALMATDNPPRTRVRLPHDVCRSLDATRRESLRADLRAVATLGAFHLSRMDTRWLDAKVQTDDDAISALAAAQNARDVLPSAQKAMSGVAEAAGLTPARTVGEWRPQLALLVGVRDTLDVLLPAVYEQPIAELVKATAPEGDPSSRRGDESGWLARRGLRRRAKALVRPGMHVPDLHERLTVAMEQRARWQEFASAGGWPRVPTGLAEAQAAATEVEGALTVLSRALEGTGTPDLMDLPLDKLGQRLADLAADGDGVLAQPKRTVLLERLRAAGLSDLIEDLSERRAGPEDVDGELDLAWWTSVLETIIRSDQRLARHDPAQLRAQSDLMRQSQESLLAARAAQVLTNVAVHGATAVAALPEQARWLRSEVHRAHRSRWPADLFAKAGDLVAALRPIWVMSPDAVARTLPAAGPESPLLDVVAVDDAGQVGLPESAAALARGRQVMVAGDRRRLPPATGGPSVIEGLATLANVSVHRLDRDHRTRDGRLLYPLLDAYPQAWGLTPGAAPISPLSLDYVADGVGMPAPGQQVALSADAEVARVVELVTEHAARRPGESLLVVTLGARHAERIEEALRVEVADRPELARWLDVHWAGDISEPFLVRPIHRIAGIERDAVIVSIGISRTPHGRVLHRFGVLDGRFGRACLVTALSRARRRTTVVCCFTADDLAPERLRSDGAQMLRDVLQLAGDPVARGDHLDRAVTARADTEAASTRPAPDPLVQDLRDRLDAVGLRVAIGPDAPDWPLALAVGDSEQPGRQLLAVEVDGPEHAACPSVTTRDRSRREAFERSGWTYVRVAAMDLFCDPAGEVERIRSSWRAAGGGAPTTATTPATGVIVGRPRVRDGFPSVTPGRPITTYTDADLEAVASWVMSDGVQRTAEDLAALVREALHLPRRGMQVEAAVGGAARRVLDGAVSWSGAVGS